MAISTKQKAISDESKREFATACYGKGLCWFVRKTTKLGVSGTLSYGDLFYRLADITLTEKPFREAAAAGENLSYAKGHTLQLCMFRVYLR